MTFTTTNFENNDAGNNGGGAFGGFQAIVTDSHFLLNEAGQSGGGIWFKNRGTITGSVFAQNEAILGWGGGIYREGKLTQLLTIETSTIHTNLAGDAGGGIYLDGLVHFENATLSANTAAGSGGAIYVGSDTEMSLANVTIANNNAGSGDALASTAATATVSWLNTIVSGTCSPDGAVFLSVGGNIESIGDTCGFVDASDQTGVTAAELNLGPLANNGGPTPTHALLPGSFAIDAGVAPCPAADQRGVLRSDGLCDVGAYESVAMETAIDIKPGSDRNPINLKKRGVIPVALLGSAAFDVTNVDVTTLTFGPADATPDHDLTDPDVYDSHIQDVNDDGFFDLVSHYRVSETGLLPEHTSACLSGVTDGGVTIGGCDNVDVFWRTKNSRNLADGGSGFRTGSR